MAPLELKSDMRWMGALFAFIGTMLTLASMFTPDGPPLFFGPVFALAGVSFSSSKYLTRFDPESRSIQVSAWKLFFLRSDRTIAYDEVEDVITARAAQKGSKSVNLHLRDGSRQTLGPFGGHEATNLALSCRKALKLDEAPVRPGSAPSEVQNLADIRGLKVKEYGDKTILLIPGQEGSILPAYACFSLAVALVAGVLIYEPQAFVVALALGPLVAGVGAVYWRRSKPSTLQVSKKEISWTWPSLLGTERRTWSWEEVEGLLVEDARTNRRFTSGPVVQIHTRDLVVSFGDGLTRNECRTLVDAVSNFASTEINGSPVQTGLSATLKKVGISWSLLKKMMLGYVVFCPLGGVVVFQAYSHFGPELESNIESYGLSLMGCYAFAVFGCWFLAFVGQFLQERRMVAFGGSGFFAGWLMGFAGGLFAMPVALLISALK